MKTIYIIGKYSDRNPSDIRKNIDQAIAKGILYAKKGYAVIVPHINFSKHAETIGYEGVMKECFELIKRSDEIYVMKNWTKSSGSIREIAWGKTLGKTIRWEK